MTLTASSTRPRPTHKARMLVVDDEPDNLDLLYRTFRREFNVLRADSGQAALQILKEQGEVAVIISDQRMPEMKGTEFLSKTVPEFPDTVRIILTGFTDVEDLVDAINAGQVYRYITKPWDPEALKRVVQRAAETYEILKQRGEALEQAAAQQQLITRLAQEAAQATSLDDILPTLAQIIQESLGAVGCVIQVVRGQSRLDQPVGIAGQGDLAQLADDPLVPAAIAEQVPQTQTNPDGAARLVAPVIFHEKVVAVIACQWESGKVFLPNATQLITLAATQLGLVMAYLGR